jgi:protein regulator of cytokinesis 1
LKAQLAAIAPQLEEFRSKKEERMKQFAEVALQIEKISGEISGGNDSSQHRPSEEEDLSIRRLDELRDRLQGLQKEKVCVPIGSDAGFRV